MFVIGFVSLLLIRMGVFQRGDTERARDYPLATQTWVDRETWMSISQHGQKIGYSHRQFSRSNEGFRVVEFVFMRINMMGMIQDIRYRTEGMFQQDLTLSSFNFDLESNLFQFKARGISDGKTLILMVGPPGSEQRVQ
ncbi:MAG: putative transglutaminase protein, partial [Deltaproteobacteria bacterium]|nr:putative transglutaminase protein [Deltaproteobacteria bacterium]